MLGEASDSAGPRSNRSVARQAKTAVACSQESSKQRKARGHRGVRFFTYVTYVQKPVLHFLSKFAQTIEELEMEEVRLQRLRYFTMFCDDIGPGLDYESSTKVLKR